MCKTANTHLKSKNVGFAAADAYPDDMDQGVFHSTKRGERSCLQLEP